MQIPTLLLFDAFTLSALSGQGTYLGHVAILRACHVISTAVLPSYLCCIADVATTVRYMGFFTHHPVKTNVLKHL